MKQPDNKLILFPDIQEIKEQIDRLQTELSMLLLERDELLFVVSENLNTRYMLELGALEYKLYKAQCTVMRLKRKMDLIQAVKNREEAVNLSAIENILDIEFEKYTKKLDEQIEKMNNALERSRCQQLTDEETTELKKLYRTVVKALHPDLNPNISDAGMRLFENAVQAYKNGDLTQMRIIYEMASSQHPINEIDNDALTVLRKRRNKLATLILEVRNSITEIKNNYPFTVLDILNDSDKLSAKRKELEKITAQYDNIIEFYTAKLKEMLR